MSKIKFVVEEVNGKCSNGMKVGDSFILENNTIYTQEDTKVCIWSLNKLMLTFPLLIEKKTIRKNHWIHSIKTMKCADGKVQFALLEE